MVYDFSDGEISIGSWRYRSISSIDRMPTRDATGRNWNERFQSLREQMLAGTLRAPTQALRSLCEEFAKVAKSIGTTIISELFMNPDERTIKPVTQAIGGIAGGEKYIHAEEGIFFKFALDTKGIYGGDEYIMKVPHDDGIAH